MAMTILVCLLLMGFGLNSWAYSGQRLCDTTKKLCMTGICPVDECLKCEDVGDAVCTTSNPKDVVPRKLPLSTKYLDLTYTGAGAELTPEMFAYLTHLKSITIRGNIVSIAPNTFERAWNLKWLTITDSELDALPNKLFNSSKKLLELDLSKNRFKYTPTNVFPQIPNIVSINLSYNPLESCRNDTLSPEFATLTHLNELRIAGYGSSIELCQNVSKDYLLPIQHIRVLDLSESLLFYGDQEILSPLKDLQQLVMTSVSPFKECPAKAAALFQNMPSKLNYITIRDWATTHYINESCVLTDRVLSGLKNLSNLAIFDAQGSDKLFGNVLSPSIFSGFRRLRTVYIDWCGISLIESGAFNAVPHVTEMGLVGNLLGPRSLKLYTNATPDLRTLNLNSVGLNIATYQVSDLLLEFPKLRLMYLDNNLLRNIPDFSLAEKFSSNVTTLTLNQNQIQRISANEGKVMCLVLNKLQNFKVENNLLIDVTGISFCLSLGYVSLASNLIGQNQYTNFGALSQLHNLTHLDLSSNKIKYLTPRLTAHLPNLNTLILGENEITFLADSLFLKTPSLLSLDLSANLLPVFNASILSSGLPELRGLYLQDNQITVLSQELLNLFDTQLTKLTYLGITGNPLVCTCDNYLSTWAKNSTAIMQVKNLTCSTPENPDVTTKLLSYEPNHFLCYVKTPLIVSGRILACVLFALLLAIPCYKYRWYLRHPVVVAQAVAEKLREVHFDGKCQYDAFISYDATSDTDSEWVIDKLIPALESLSDGDQTCQSNLRLYIVDRDSAVGSPKYTEKCRAIEGSRKVLLLLSNSYLANPACLSEADLVAGYGMVDGEQCYQPNRILVLILEELNEEAIRSPVTSLLTQNVIHVGESETEMKRLWKRVRRFLAKPRYIYRKKTRIAETDTQCAHNDSLTTPLVSS